jgi:hypothetical protein
MKAKTTFVWADGAVHLNAETAIDLESAFVIDPGYAELDDSFGFRDAFQDFSFGVNGMFQDIRDDIYSYFLNGLEKFGLVRITCLDVLHKFPDMLSG